MSVATDTAQVLIAGKWRAAKSSGTFHAVNPATKEQLPETFPVSTWEDIDAALDAAVSATDALAMKSADDIAGFLEAYADLIDGKAEAIAEAAAMETALPASPRLKDIELARTTNQLRQAATAAREGTWAVPTIDTKMNIRSMFGPIGPVVIFGPNNFPLAYNAVSGGDFAAAIAAGNPVIAKAHPCHPTTTRMLAELANEAAESTDMPAAIVQLIYHMSNEDGLKLVADARTGAIGFTGSRGGGLALKEVADKAGNPIYLEMSSINPVVILPGALEERNEELVDQFTTSCLMATGQFCTNPGLVILPKSEATEAFIAAVADRFKSAPSGTLLAEGVEQGIAANIESLKQAGAQVIVGGKPGDEDRFCYANTLLRVDGDAFLARARSLQTEAFGNASLFVVADGVEQMERILETLEGNLTGCIYSHTGTKDDGAYERVAAKLRPRVGRLLNDKMPTGVAVTSAMQHGGPYPSTGHPGFTAVGFPATIRRFAMLLCYDNVRQHRLPRLLQDKNPTSKTWRYVDGQYTTSDM